MSWTKAGKIPESEMEDRGLHLAAAQPTACLNECIRNVSGDCSVLGYYSTLHCSASGGGNNIKMSIK